MCGRGGRILGAALVAALITIQTAQARPGSSSTERAYATAINDVRRAHGLNPLTQEQALFESARGHSADMVDNHYFAHGGDWWKRLVQAGSTGPRLGENLG